MRREERAASAQEYLKIKAGFQRSLYSPRATVAYSVLFAKIVMVLTPDLRNDPYLISIFGRKKERPASMYNKNKYIIVCVPSQP